jgi:hypothetical protein
MVALKAPTGSTPLAWVKVATVMLFGVRLLVTMGAETTMAGSETDVLALALLLPVFVAEVVTDDESVRVPSSMVCAVTVTVTVGPLATTVPSEKVITPPDCEYEPWLVVAVTKVRLAPSVLVRTVLGASFGGAAVFFTVYV